MHNVSEMSHVAILHSTKMIKDESREEYLGNGNCPITEFLLINYYYTFITPSYLGSYHSLMTV